MKYLWLVVFIILVVVDRWIHRSTNKMITDFAEELHRENPEFERRYLGKWNLPKEENDEVSAQ